MQSSLISYEPLGACDFEKNKIRIYIYLYRGSKGQKLLDTDILETRGQKYLDGDSKRTMKAVFYWAPVFVCLFVYAYFFICESKRKFIFLHIIYLIF